MSGGHFDYNQYRMHDIRMELKELIECNDNNEKNEYGDTIGNHFSPETIKRFKEGHKALEVAEIFTQRIDYLVSGDDSEKTFHERLNAELNRATHGDKEFKGTPTLDDWKSVSYRMREEGFDYCFDGYSDWNDNPDPTFHRLRKQYLESMNELHDYIEKKLKEAKDGESETDI